MQTLFVGPEHVQPLSFTPASDQPVADAHAIHEEAPPITTHGGRPPFNRLLYFRIKRLLDLTLTLCALGLLWPLLLLIAVAIKLDSPGPIFVAQERVGGRRQRHQKLLDWGQTRFLLYKFRTTVVMAKPTKGSSRHALHYTADSTGAAVLQAAIIEQKSDRALTQVGRFLQQTCLDQLPQLWNILKGDLSLVGPRPVHPVELTHYAPSDLRRFATLPGMTGLWQLRAPSAGQARRQTKGERERQRVLNLEQMVQADLEYIDQQSLRLDLQILGNTLLAALHSYTPLA